MKKSCKFLLALVSIGLLSACQTHFSTSPQEGLLTEDQDIINLNERLDDGRHIQKVDNLLFLVDDSNAAMLQRNHQGISKRDLEFALVTRIQRTIPNIKLNQGIRIFGPNANQYDFKNTLLYGLSQDTPEKLKPVIINNTMEDTMFNPVAMALQAEYRELKPVKGNTAILVFSAFNGPDPQSLDDSAALINEYYHGQVSIYPIYFGSKNGGEYAKAARLPALAGGGTAVKAEELQDSANLADFVESVLFNVSSPTPVISETQKVAPKVHPPVAKTVLSHKKLVKEKVLRIKLKALFDFDKAVILPKYKDKLEAVADFMKKYPETTAVIEGHTSSEGTEEYNLILSEKRAKAVRDYLVKSGVSSTRFDILAYGETKPIADNATEEGRRENRRVVAVIKTKVKKK